MNEKKQTINPMSEILESNHDSLKTIKALGISDCESSVDCETQQWRWIFSSQQLGWPCSAVASEEASGLFMDSSSRAENSNLSSVTELSSPARNERIYWSL